jgi:flagellar protein FliS
MYGNLSFGSSEFGQRAAAGAYMSTHVTSGTMSANPHQLISMLFEGAIEALGRAQASLQTKDIEGKNRAVSKALRIIEEGLRASLDRRVGGEIAQNLDSLYDYMARRLLAASLRNDAAGIAEVGTLLSTIRTAWEQIGGKGIAASPMTAGTH